MKSFFSGLFVIIISGYFFFCSSYFGQSWYLMWLAPVPVLIYSYRNSFFKTSLVCFLVGLAPGLNDIVGYWSTAIPAAPFILRCLLQSLNWTIIVLLCRGIVRRNKSPFSVFAYPTLLALNEWLLSFTQYGTFWSIAYSQLSVLPLIQIASLTGFIGITFVVATFSAGLAHLISFWNSQKKAWQGFLLSLALVFFTFCFGYFQIYRFNHMSIKTLKIGLASVSYPPEHIFDTQYAQIIFAKYQTLIQQLKQKDAHIILLPEEALSVNDKTVEHYKSLFAHLAASNQQLIIVGLNIEKNNHHYNSAWLFTPQGKWLGEYQKRHFVPVVESDLVPGASLLTFNIDRELTAGIAICRDLDYPQPARDYGALATQLLFVPAWDFEVDAELHRKGALLESIQNGYTLIRAARGGFLSVSTPYGKILAQIFTSSNTGDTLIVDTPIFQNHSLYPNHPYWFGLLLILILLGLIYQKANRSE